MRVRQRSVMGASMDYVHYSHKRDGLLEIDGRNVGVDPRTHVRLRDPQICYSVSLSG